MNIFSLFWERVEKITTSLEHAKVAGRESRLDHLAPATTGQLTKVMKTIAASAMATWVDPLDIDL
jgi:hypothetical protein